MISCLLKYKKTIYAICSLSAGLILVLYFLFFGSIGFSGKANLFHLLQIVYIFLLVNFVFYVIFTVVSGNFKGKAAFILFLTILFYTLIWTTQGIDFTDEGYQLSKSWFMLHGLWKENINIVWFTDFVSGLWLSIIGVPSLLWARAGFALLTSLTAYFTFKLFCKYFSIVPSFFMVLPPVFLLLIFSAQTINYNNFPVLLVILGIFCMSFMIEEGKNPNIYGILSGIFFSLAVFARISFILFPFMAFLYLIIDSFFYMKDFKKLLNNISVVFYGLIIGFSGAFLILYFTNSVSAYIDFIRENMFERNPVKIVTNRPFFSTIRNNLYDFAGMIRLSIKWLPVLIFSGLITAVKNKKMAVLISVIMLPLLLDSALNIENKTWYNYILGVVTACFIIYILNYLRDDWKKVTRVKLFLSFWALILLVISHLGTGNDIIQVFITGGMFLFMPLCLLSFMSIDINFSKHPDSFKYVSVILLISLLISSVILKYGYVYRDDQRKNLNTMFMSDPLFGIFSTRDRVLSLDNILTVINNNMGDKQKTLLCLDYMPMLPYISGYKYFIIPDYAEYSLNPGYAPPEVIERALGKPIEGVKPGLIVFNFQSFALNWPDADALDLKEIPRNYYVSFIKKNGYKKIYSDRMFELYRQ